MKVVCRINLKVSLINHCHNYYNNNSFSFTSYIFSENVSHDFKLDIEIYYTVSSDNAANRTSGVKRPVRKTPTGHEVPKFVLAGHTQLTVDHLHDGIKSHDLKTGKMTRKTAQCETSLVYMCCVVFRNSFF